VSVSSACQRALHACTWALTPVRGTPLWTCTAVTPVAPSVAPLSALTAWSLGVTPTVPGRLVLVLGRSASTPADAAACGARLWPSLHATVASGVAPTGPVGLLLVKVNRSGVGLLADGFGEAPSAPAGVPASRRLRTPIGLSPSLTPEARTRTLGRGVDRVSLGPLRFLLADLRVPLVRLVLPSAATPDPDRAAHTDGSSRLLSLLASALTAYTLARSSGAAFAARACLAARSCSGRGLRPPSVGHLTWAIAALCVCTAAAWCSLSAPALPVRCGLVSKAALSASRLSSSPGLGRRAWATCACLVVRTDAHAAAQGFVCAALMAWFRRPSGLGAPRIRGTARRLSGACVRGPPACVRARALGVSVSLFSSLRGVSGPGGPAHARPSAPAPPLISSTSMGYARPVSRT
jgi:hypothetical protein